jgi:hypothetical protein
MIILTPAFLAKYVAMCSVVRKASDDEDDNTSYRGMSVTNIMTA